LTSERTYPPIIVIPLRGGPSEETPIERVRFRQGIRHFSEKAVEAKTTDRPDQEE